MRRSATREALAGLGTSVTAAPEPPSVTQSVVDTVTGWLSRRTSRRGFLVRSGVVGSALAVDPFGFVLRPGTAYAAVCGPGASCSSGWTVFCATINKGVNACPPGSIAAGWWKMDGASLCGGQARYIIDCNATCSRCTTGSSRAGICAPSCWSCTCTCGPSGSCDQRKVCCNGFRYGQCNTQVRQVGAVQCRVVSCTPPWQFERCSTSPATDNRTRDHNSSELPQVWNAISARYVALGENGSVLGATVYGQVAVPEGRAQRYQRGRISSHPTHGTWETHGAIHARYAHLGLEAGVMGFPVFRPAAVPGGGTAQRFTGGRITSHPESGTWEVQGALAVRYVALAAEDGPLGYPLGGTGTVAGGAGRAQRFQGGRLSSSAPTGTWEVLGPLAAAYQAAGTEAGRLGFPLASQARVAGGLAQRFQRGRLSWSGATGARVTDGPIAELFRVLGSETGPLGFPTSDTSGVPGGQAQKFVGGRASWSASTGAHWAGAAIAEAHRLVGAEAGELGFPLTDQALDGDGRPFVTYQGGTLTDTGTEDGVVRS